MFTADYDINAKAAGHFVSSCFFAVCLNFLAFQFLAQTVWATVGIIFVLALLASISEIEQQQLLFLLVGADSSAGNPRISKFSRCGRDCVFYSQIGVTCYCGFRVAKSTKRNFSSLCLLSVNWNWCLLAR